MSSVRIRKWTLKLSPKCGEAAGFWGHSPSTPRLPLTSRPRPGDSHSSSHATHHTGAQTAALGAGGLSLQPGNREVPGAGRCPHRVTPCALRAPHGAAQARGLASGHGEMAAGCAEDKDAQVTMAVLLPPTQTGRPTEPVPERPRSRGVQGESRPGPLAGSKPWPGQTLCLVHVVWKWARPSAVGFFFFFFWRKGGGLSGPFRDPYRDQRLRGAGSASSAVLPRSAGQRTCEHDSSPGSLRPARGRPLHFGVTVLDDTVTNSGTGKDQR